MKKLEIRATPTDGVKKSYLSPDFYQLQDFLLNTDNLVNFLKTDKKSHYFGLITSSLISNNPLYQTKKKDFINTKFHFPESPMEGSMKLYNEEIRSLAYHVGFIKHSLQNFIHFPTISEQQQNNFIIQCFYSCDKKKINLSPNKDVSSINTRKLSIVVYDSLICKTPNMDFEKTLDLTQRIFNKVQNPFQIENDSNLKEAISRSKFLIARVLREYSGLK